MKLVAGAFLLFLLPVLAFACSVFPRARMITIWLVGISLARVGVYTLFADMPPTILGRALEREVDGIDVTNIDLLCLALLPSQLFGTQRREGRPAVRLLRLANFVAVLASAVLSSSPLVSCFSVWKLARMNLVFSVMVVELAELRAVRALLTGMATAAFLQVPVVLYGRYALHLDRPGGTLENSNALSLQMNLIGGVALACVFAPRAGLLAWLTVPVVLGCHLFDHSRSGIVIFFCMVAFTIVGTLLRGHTPGKWKALALFGVAGLVAAPVVVPRMVRRFLFHDGSFVVDSAIQSRLDLIHSASLMIRDRPWGGVGANRFTTALVDGYGAQANLVMSNWHYPVHNTYLLMIAELGVPGGATYVALVLAFLWAALRGATQRGIRGDVALGAAAAIGGALVHSMTDFTVLVTPQSYGFWVVAALAVALEGHRKSVRQ